MSKQTRKFYNRFSPLYPIVDVFLSPQKRKLLSEVNKLPSGSLLEIGVGRGEHLKHYKGHQIIGIDTSEKMLQIAKRNNTTDIEMLQMNGEVLTFADNTFDLVVLSHVIAVVVHPDQLIKEVYRVLKPSGKVFILNHFTPDNWIKYIDYAFQPLSGLFHFKSVFKITSVKSIENFYLYKEIKLAPYSYFKLLIYGKA